MVVSKYDLQRIRIYKGTSKPDFKPMIEEVAQLYQSGKITKKGTKSGIARAIQMAERLGAERQKTRDVGLRQLEEVKSGERNIAPGKTTVPMSRPSVTKPGKVAKARWRMSNACLISGIAAIWDALCPHCSVRIKAFTRSSFNMTSLSSKLSGK